MRRWHGCSPRSDRPPRVGVARRLSARLRRAAPRRQRMAARRWQSRQARLRAGSCWGQGASLQRGDLSVLHRPCPGIAAGAAQDGTMSPAPADLSGPPVMTLPKHPGDIREPLPVHRHTHARKTWGSILTCPNEQPRQGARLRTESTRRLPAGPGLTRSTRCSRNRRRLKSCASRSRRRRSASTVTGHPVARPDLSGHVRSTRRNTARPRARSHVVRYRSRKLRLR